MFNGMSKKKIMTYLILLLAGGTMYKLYFMVDSFYIQMQEYFNLTNTQIGVIYSVAGWVSQFGFLVAMYITDRIPRRKLMSAALIANGITGLYLSTYPSFSILLVLFCMFAVFTDMLCWPTILKTVRLMGNKEEQGRMFGFLETGRGITDTVVNFLALGIFVYFGSSSFGFRCSIIFWAAISIAIGIAIFFLLEDEDKTEINTGEVKNQFSNIKEVLTNKDVWFVSLNVFTIYILYTGIKYFVPFLHDIYGLPVALATAYGIINTYGLKMVGGPISGVLADKGTHSATKFIRIMFTIFAAFIAAYYFLPHGNMSVQLAMTIALIISACVFCMRAIFFAPMDEIDVPRNLTGATMGFGSFIGYLPGAFMSIIFGMQLDAHPGLAGYKNIFLIMFCTAIFGLILSTKIISIINKKNNKVE